MKMNETFRLAPMRRSEKGRDMKRKRDMKIFWAAPFVALAAAAVMAAALGTTRGESAAKSAVKKLKFKYGRSKVLDSGNFKVRWRLKDDVLTVALESSYSRYMALGISTEPRMKGADFIIAKIDGGKVVSVQDHFGNEKHKHKPDKLLGGTSRIRKFYDRSAGDWRVVEIVMKAVSDDPNDVSVTPGSSFYFLVAGSSMPDWLTRHPFYDKFKASF
jgi:hypothetical protein